MRGAPEYRTSRACLCCQQDDLVPSMAEGWQRPEQTSPDCRSCPCWNSVGRAGSSDKKSQVFQEYVAGANLRSEEEPTLSAEPGVSAMKPANDRAHHTAVPLRFP